MKTSNHLSKEFMKVNEIYTCKKDWNYLIENGTEKEWHIIKSEALVEKKYVYGNEIFLRGIIEFSNYCRKNCLYCGIRRDSPVSRYRMSKEEIIACAKKIFQSGIRTIVLQSGEDTFYTQSELSLIIREIKKELDVAITLCIGERSFDDYKAFFDAGANRFLIKHETSNPKLFAYFHPGETLKDRLKCYENLKKIGYQVGLGNIVGLPYTAICDYINDILLIKDLEADMAGIGPFIPSLNTPLAHFKSPDLNIIPKLISMARIEIKGINIPATTALYSLGAEAAVKDAFLSGANVVMPNFTPASNRINYKIYDNKKPLTVEYTKKIIEEAGFFYSESKGDRIYAKCA